MLDEFSYIQFAGLTLFTHLCHDKLNGCYTEPCFLEFPIRGHKCILHVLCRICTDLYGHNISTYFSLMEKYTRCSKELVVYLRSGSTAIL